MVLHLTVSHDQVIRAMWLCGLLLNVFSVSFSFLTTGEIDMSLTVMSLATVVGVAWTCGLVKPS